MNRKARNVNRIGATDIAAILRKEIESGNYRRNDRLPASRHLAQSYGVARNTLRDALAQLEREGLLETRAGSGTYVIFEPEIPTISAIDDANPLELIDARFALEPHICRLAVLHGSREDFAQLEELCAKMEAAKSDPIQFSEADSEFHRRLAITTKNRILVWMINQVNRVRSMDEWTRMRRLTLEPQIIGQYNEQHRQILAALRDREPERAANQMKEHLETARLSLTRVVES